jgi:hypothetical protein
MQKTLTDNQMIETLDLTMNELYEYFKIINQRLKNDSFEDDLKNDKYMQGRLLERFDEVRELLENK